MKDEFAYYKAYYFSDDLQAFKSRKFYNKKEAIEWFESLAEKQSKLNGFELFTIKEWLDYV